MDFLGFFDFHHNVQHLIFQPFDRDHEVQQRDLSFNPYFDTDFRGEMRVRQFGRHEEGEMRVEINGFVPELQFVRGTDLDGLVLEHRVEGLVDVFAQILQQDPFAVGDRVFHLEQQLILGKVRSQDDKFRIFVHLAHPNVGLHLRVNHQGPNHYEH